MKDSTGFESAAQQVSQPYQVASMVSAGRAVGFDLDADDSRGAEVGDKVHLVAAVAVSQVVYLGPCRVHNCLGPYLVGHERVDESAEQIAVAHHQIQISSHRRAPQPGVGDIPLGGPSQPLQTIAAPCRHLGDDSDVGQQLGVRARRAPVIMTAGAAASTSASQGSTRRAKYCLIVSAYPPASEAMSLLRMVLCRNRAPVDAGLAHPDG